MKINGCNIFRMPIETVYSQNSTKASIISAIAIVVFTAASCFIYLFYVYKVYHEISSNRLKNLEVQDKTQETITINDQANQNIKTNDNSFIESNELATDTKENVESNCENKNNFEDVTQLETDNEKIINEEENKNDTKIENTEIEIDENRLKKINEEIELFNREDYKKMRDFFLGEECYEEIFDSLDAKDKLFNEGELVVVERSSGDKCYGIMMTSAKYLGKRQSDISVQIGKEEKQSPFRQIGNGQLVPGLAVFKPSRRCNQNSVYKIPKTVVSLLISSHKNNLFSKIK